MSKDLNPEKALIFRITHRDNVPWILDNGLHCRNSESFDPDFVNIGSLELIDKRQNRVIEVPPGGTLSDYVPFYFTPFSPMLFNINTGFGGITNRPNREIVILVASLHALAADGRAFVFSDRHAYLQTARFSADLADLDRIDWPKLQARDFKKDVNDLERFELYQAEALVHRHMPVNSLKGIVCHYKAVKDDLDKSLDKADPQLKVVVKPSWYFR